MFKLDLEKAEEPEIKLPTSIRSAKKQERSRKTSTSALLTAQAFDCVDHNKWSKILQEHHRCFHVLFCNGTHTSSRTAYFLLWLNSHSPVQFSEFSHSAVSDSLWPHGLQHARLPCPSPTSGVYSNSCPLSQWCHPTSSSSVVPFSSHLQSFPASGSFQMSQCFTSGG